MKKIAGIMNDPLCLNTDECKEELVIGQQVYNLLVLHYFFQFVSQDVKICRRLANDIPSDIVLEKVINNIIDNKIWTSKEICIKRKITISYIILACLYNETGFDNIFSLFSDSIRAYTDVFLKCPVRSCTKLLDDFLQNNSEKAVKYRVDCIKKSPENENDYCAKTNYKGISFVGYGYSPKNAIENTARQIVFDHLSERLIEMAIFQGYNDIIPHHFRISTVDYNEDDYSIKELSRKYNIDCLLLKFSLLTKKQANQKSIENSNISKFAELVGTAKTNLTKRLFIYEGQEILLLNTLILWSEKGLMKEIDISQFDILSLKMSHFEIHDKMIGFFKIKELSIRLFDYLNLSSYGMINDDERTHVIFSFISSFYLSNFNPDKQFGLLFDDILSDFFSNFIHVDIDYKYASIAYFSSLNIRIETNIRESANGLSIYDIIIGKNKTPLIISSEDSDISKAKKNAWFQVYSDIILSFYDVLIKPDAKIKKEYFIFLSKAYINAPKCDSLLSTLGILLSRNYKDVGIDNAKQIAKNIYLLLDNSQEMYLRFISCFEQYDKGYIVIADRIYNYNLLLKNLFDVSKISPVRIEDYNDNIFELYNNIINPNNIIQTKFLNADYRCIRCFYPLSNEIAIYAIDQTRDAYNYLPQYNEFINDYYEKVCNQSQKSLQVGTLVSKIDDCSKFIIFDSHRSVNDQFMELINDMPLTRIVIACGYCFSSGLELIKNIVEIGLERDVNISFYIGSLQNYFEAGADNRITSIDKTTVYRLNKYLEKDCFQLYTCTDRFFHGKIYVFEGLEKTVICLGSSNISRSAYISNYELNIGLSIPSNSNIKNMFDEWISQLNSYSKPIFHLDESLFGENELRQDGSVVLKGISRSKMIKRIESLTDDEIKYRLNLWISYNPDIIAEDLGVISLPNYFVFVYERIKLLVLESFTAGNSYYCIHFEGSFEDIINDISSLSKTEIFEYSHMQKRGYHISNKINLENSIRKYFINSTHISSSLP